MTLADEPRRLLSCVTPLSLLREDETDDELLEEEDEDLAEEELLTEVEPEEFLLLLSCELLVTVDEDFRRLLSCELLADEELPEDERVLESVVLLLAPEERLSCEYESTGAASIASAIADKRVTFRMFFMMIQC